ncbi:hypothetical protein AS026_37445 [Rhizobium altiplani]|uniref:Integrase n=1 Tax=Rhizobium altiplani TaxID=1864509 RepID=A0A109JVH8_9HYPH|nr:site-specific integrase [Rhizobium altiplani]KWV55725.1 hypothetical protein AS026_37445 [Rhizobium altiplani]
MAEFISEDFIKNRVPRLMKDRDEIKVRDSKLPGFVVRCRRQSDGNISRVFMIDYIPPMPPVAAAGKAKRKWLVVGSWPTFNAEDARESARLLLLARKEGDDPKAKRAQKLAQPTFEQLWELFEKEHLVLKKESTRKSYTYRYNRILLPAFAGRRVADITRSEINSLKIKHKNRSTDLNRALATLSKMFSFAMIHEMRNDNPCAKVQRFAERVSDSWLDENDLPAFLEVLNKREQGPMSDFIRFLAVTGWRIGVALSLRWDQIDLKRREVHLEDTETKKVATVISADAAILIDRQPNRLGYVFSRRKGTQPIGYNDVRAEMASICKEAKIAKITPHGLRRSAATHGAIAGANVAELRWSSPTSSTAEQEKKEKQV